MILEFSIRNYRSFKDQQTLSMIPDEGKKEYVQNIFSVNKKVKILRSGVVYGANASGKSNLMRAMQMLRSLILNSAKYEPGESFAEYDPFRFNPQTEKAPSVFSINFLLDQVRYHYEVEIHEKKVVKESLLFYPQGREAKLYIREEQEFEFGDFLKGKKAVIAEITSPNQLFLSKASLNNLQQLVKVYQFFHHQFMAISFLDSWVDSYYTDKIANELFKAQSNQSFVNNFHHLLTSFDTGISNFSIEKSELKGEQEFEIFVDHKIYDNDSKELGIRRHSIREESTGTQKLFVLGGLVLRALMNGRVLVIDEFERSLHPFITSFIIQMFQDEKINSKGAQLIIATHDTHLLTGNELRRDQLWLVEKNYQGSTELYSLADITGIRAEAPFEKWYLSGKFGGVPGLMRLDLELNFEHEKI